jgi:hypothetical protein
MAGSEMNVETFIRKRESPTPAVEAIWRIRLTQKAFSSKPVKPTTGGDKSELFQKA